jgi:hypothetical protein
VIVITCLLWLAAATFTWWLLMRQAAAPEPAAETGDPHAGTIAQFMREVHDWDRRA